MTKNLTAAALLGALLVLLAPVAARAQATGCDLGFLPTTGPTPNINGANAAGEWTDAYTLQSGNCVTALPDAPPGSTSIMQIDASLPAHAIVIGTKRTATHLFILVDVADESIPQSAGSGGVGDRVVVVLDPDNSKGVVPVAGDFRLDLITFRGAPASDTKDWYAGSGVAVNPWTLQGGLPAGVEVVRDNRPPGAPGYVVEIKIPFSAIGYTLGASADVITDIGVAVAVVNDLGFQAEIIAGEGPTTITTGANFPDTAALALNNMSNVIEIADPFAGEWAEPSNWATGFFTGAGQSVFFNHTPYFWKSNDIKVGLTSASVTAANFDSFMADVSPDWYKYKTSGTPCTLRVWARMRRKAGVGDIKRRVLFLWAEHGSSPQRWHFIHLTAPVALTPGMTTAVTIGKEWAGVPPNKPNHPCLRAFILPETDAPGFGLPFFQNINAAVDGNNENKITQLMNAYGLANHSVAQMNIGTVDNSFNCNAQPTVPCSPPCVAFGGGAEEDGSPVRFLRASLSLPAFSALAAPEAPDAPAPAAAAAPQRDDRRTKFFVDLEVYGVSKTGGARKYSFVEVLGGVAELVDTAEFQERGQMAFAFNVDNPGDRPRHIFVVPHVRGGPAGVRVNVVQPTGEFAPGETRPLVAVVTKDGRDGGTVVPTPDGDSTDTPAPASEKRWGLSLHAGASVPHSTFNNIFNAGPNVGLDLEYRINDHVSLEGIYTFHRFRGGNFGGFTFDDLNLHQFSLNGKLYGGTSPVRPFFNFGGGAYKFDPGDTRGGVGVGGGVQFNVTPTFAVEGAYNFHNVFTPGNDRKFSTVQGGVRFRF